MNFYKKNVLCGILILSTISFYSMGQSRFIKEYDFSDPEIPDWTYDGMENERYIDKRSEGFIMGFEFLDPEMSNHSYRIVMTDESGELTGMQKKYRFDEPVSGIIHLIALTSGAADDGFFLMDRSGNSGNYFIRCNNAGDVLWSKKLSILDDSGNFRCSSDPIALQAQDGNIVIVGEFAYEFGKKELLFVKLNQSTGAIMMCQQIRSTSGLGEGFFPRHIIEKEENEFYVVGSGYGVDDPTFIARIYISPLSSLIVGVKRINIPHIYSITKDYQGLVISGGAGMYAASDDTYLFRINDDLSNIRALNNTPNQMDLYTGAGHVYDVTSHYDRLAIVGNYHPDHTNVHFVSMLSNDGEVLNTQSYSDDFGVYPYQLSIFDSESSFFVGEFLLGTSPKNLRLTAFTLDGNTCDQEPLSIIHSYEPISTESITFTVNSRVFEFTDVTLNEDSDMINKEDHCVECEISAEDFAPITTNIGPLSMCDLSSIDLIAPTGFVQWDWYHLGIPMGTEETLTITEGGVYVLVGTDADGCAVELLIEILPGIDLDSMDATTFCVGTTTNLPVLSTSGYWSGPFVAISGADITFLPTETGTFDLIYTDAETGCESIFTVEVIQSAFTFNSTPSCSGASSGTIVLTSSDASSYNWTLSGPFSESILDASEATFDDLPTGVYTVSGIMNEAPFCSHEQIVEVLEIDAEWPKTTTNAWGSDHATDVNNDASGNIYMIGDFESETNFDGLTLDIPTTWTQAAYTASYDPCGDLKWVALVEGKQVTASRMAVDQDFNRIYVVGTFNGVTNFYNAQLEDGTYPCGTAVVTVGSSSQQGAYVATYSTEGCLLNVFELPAFPGAYIEGEAIAASSYEDAAIGLNHRVYFAIKTTVSGSTPGTSVRIFSCTPNLVFPYNLAVNWTESMISNKPIAVNDMETYEGHIAITGSFSKELIHGSESLFSPDDKSDAFIYNWFDTGTSPSVKFEKDLYSSSTPYQHGIGHTITMEANKIIVGGEYRSHVSGAFSGPNLASPPMAADGGFIGNLDFGGGVNWIYSVSGTKTASVKSLDSEDDKLFIAGDYSGDDFYASTTLIATASPGYHNFATNWSVSTGPIGGWINIATGSTASTQAPVNEGITYVNDHIYAGGDYIGNMGFSFSSSGVGPLVSSPVGSRNAYLWRLEAPSGLAKSNVLQTAASDKTPYYNVYPNPTDGAVHITLSDKDQTWEYEIYSPIGQLLSKGVIQGKETIELTNKTPGIYMLILRDGKKVMTRKIVLK